MEEKYFLTGEKLVNPYSPRSIKISQGRGKSIPSSGYIPISTRSLFLTKKSFIQSFVILLDGVFQKTYNAFSLLKSKNSTNYTQQIDYNIRIIKKVIKLSLPFCNSYDFTPTMLLSIRAICTYIINLPFDLLLVASNRIHACS